MYYDFTVPVPEVKGKIYCKKVKEAVYVHYQYDSVYNPEKKYAVPKRTTIGKKCENDETMMYPNPRYYEFFPDEQLPEETEDSSRSSCLKVGSYLAIKKAAKVCGVDKVTKKVFGDRSELLMDIAAYSIVCESNVMQYYEDYAYNHALFTYGMKIYSDSTISDFFRWLDRDKTVEFLDAWNEIKNHEDKIYISYDSTNKNCQAGDIEIAEYGHAKDDKDKPVVGYAVAYDTTNCDPLFYEDYPGSIVDITQLRYMIDKAVAYGYRNVGVILDRGYFSEANLRYMDKNGYDFIIMMKGKKALVKEIVLEYKGTFEETIRNSIYEHKVNGITVKMPLLKSDEKDRYIHIYYSVSRYERERRDIERKLEEEKQSLKKMEGTDYVMDEKLNRHFEAEYYHKGEEDQMFLGARELYDKIDEEIALCGYFAIVTSEEMTAEEAIEIYKSRDASEKLFRADKAFLGNGCYRSHDDAGLSGRLLVEFTALIIRNRIYRMLKDEKKRTDSRSNYMSVPKALRELDKIEMVKNADGKYRLAHAVTKHQKEILSAFNITAADVKREAGTIGDTLKYYEEQKNE